jgi:hypothetical protein
MKKKLSNKEPSSRRMNRAISMQIFGDAVKRRPASRVFYPKANKTSKKFEFESLMKSDHPSHSM